MDELSTEERLVLQAVRLIELEKQNEHLKAQLDIKVGPDIMRYIYYTEQSLALTYDVMAACPPCPTHGNRCGPHAVEWIESTRDIIAALETEVKRTQGALRAIGARVTRTQKQGRIAVPAALWILDIVDAALEPLPKSDNTEKGVG